MPKIEVYSSPFCGFCHRAKRLLTQKGAQFTEIDVIAHPERRNEMVQRAKGGRTVPQIFIDGQHVGGCDDLFALDRRGGLDPLLKAG
ncbi:MAG: glutaredoxin 3 [Rhodobacteraceae bacterium]|jgi:glutaredoxin 3|nr:glutaredoxin 3 [Paracoccaceae bacterium]